MKLVAPYCGELRKFETFPTEVSFRLISLEMYLGTQNSKFAPFFSMKFPYRTIDDQ